MKQEERQRKIEEFRKKFESENQNFEIIPSYADIGEEEKRQKELVGAYCRVSTKQEAQIDSFLVQKAYYESFVKKREDWELVHIYADEGISATSMKRRKDFLRMIDDCKSGKLTRIVTKSVSRFGRNVVDTIDTVRKLRSLSVPVGVLFETEGIDTLRRDSDILLSVLASFAESESTAKSTSVKWGIRNRFDKQIPRICDLYGFERNDLNLTIKPEEGKIIAYMYELLFDGFTPGQIAKHLTSLKIPTPTRKNEAWNTSAVRYILSNEKNCGDVVIQKTITVDIFPHKVVKNTGQIRGYRLKNHHPAIVSYEDWLYACVILKEAPVEKLLLKDAPSLVVNGFSFYPIDMSKAVAIQPDLEPNYRRRPLPIPPAIPSSSPEDDTTELSPESNEAKEE